MPFYMILYESAPIWKEHSDLLIQYVKSAKPCIQHFTSLKYKTISIKANNVNKSSAVVKSNLPPHADSLLVREETPPSLCNEKKVYLITYHHFTATDLKLLFKVCH